MTKALVDKLYQSGQAAQKRIAQMSAQEKGQLEESWDIEHAYYSSALEGSKLDRTEIEELAKHTK